jgi:hypothetical protein
MASLDDILTELNDISGQLETAMGSARRALEHRRKELHTQAEVWDTAGRRDAWVDELRRLKERREKIEDDLIVVSSRRKSGVAGMLWGEWNWHKDAERLNGLINKDAGRDALDAKIANLERRLGLNQ